MSEIKPGDRVWAPFTYEDDGEAYLLRNDDLLDSRLLAPPAANLIPDSPALPAVARLLASDGGTLAAAVRQSADLLAHYGCGYTDVLQRQIALMHQLAAALEGTDGN